MFKNTRFLWWCFRFIALVVVFTLVIEVTGVLDYFLDKPDKSPPASDLTAKVLAGDSLLTIKPNQTTILVLLLSNDDAQIVKTRYLGRLRADTRQTFPIPRAGLPSGMYDLEIRSRSGSRWRLQFTATITVTRSREASRVTARPSF